MADEEISSQDCFRGGKLAQRQRRQGQQQAGRDGMHRAQLKSRQRVATVS